MPSPPDPTLTHKLLAKALGVTVTTIKSYRRKFPEFWRVASQGRPMRFAPDSLELCRRIKHHFGRGLSVEAVRARLSEEFEAASPPEVPAARTGAAPLPPRDPQPDALARMEHLMEGLFSLQNRTHSLLAELVAKLDTLADRMAEAGPTAAAPRAPAPRPSAAQARRVERPRLDKAVTTALGEPAPLPGGERPPAALLDLPVAVLSADGEFLGVTVPGSGALNLARFERHLAGLGGPGRTARWTRDGGEWELTVEADGQARQYRFLQAATPRGNTVARLASLTVDGERASEAALQAFLRLVKDAFAR